MQSKGFNVTFEGENAAEDSQGKMTAVGWCGIETSTSNEFY